jgi:hypothetical protein
MNLSLLELCTKLTKKQFNNPFQKIKNIFLPHFSFFRPIVARLGPTAKSGLAQHAGARWDGRPAQQREQTGPTRPGVFLQKGPRGFS